MLDLTVIIITKNEEDNLSKCIKSFNGIAKRFVIVDSYSTDKTKELCYKLKRELCKDGISLDFYENEFVNHSEQINWSIKNTEIKTEWCMRIDADEELMSELSTEIKNKLSLLSKEISGVVLRRRVYFMGKWIRHGGRYPEKLLRIFRTGKGFCEQKEMDEHLVITTGKTIEFKFDFIDHNKKDLDWWINKHNWYSNKELLNHSQISNENDRKKSQSNRNILNKQARSKRLAKNVGYYNFPKFYRAHFYFMYRYYFRLGFLDGVEGKIYHFLQAYWYRFLVDAKIHELEKQKNRNNLK